MSKQDNGGNWIIRASDLRPSTESGDAAVHRKKQSPPLDYRLQNLTGGRARAIGAYLPLPGVSPRDISAGGTGWHYHNCDVQIACILQGSIDIFFRDRESRKAHAGEIMIIPGGVPHHADNASADYALLEVSFPATFDTIPCPTPPSHASTEGFVLGDASFSSNGPIASGVQEYRLTPRISQLVDLYRLSAGANAAPRSGGALALTFVVAGSCEIEYHGEHERLGRFDMFVDLHPQDAQIQHRSHDFAALHFGLH